MNADLLTYAVSANPADWKAEDILALCNLAREAAWTGCDPVQRERFERYYEYRSKPKAIESVPADCREGFRRFQNGETAEKAVSSALRDALVFSGVSSAEAQHAYDYRRFTAAEIAADRAKKIESDIARSQGTAGEPWGLVKFFPEYFKEFSGAGGDELWDSGSPNYIGVITQTPAELEEFLNAGFLNFAEKRKIEARTEARVSKCFIALELVKEGWRAVPAMKEAERRIAARLEAEGKAKAEAEAIASQDVEKLAVIDAANTEAEKVSKEAYAKAHELYNFDTRGRTPAYRRSADCAHSDIERLKKALELCIVAGSRADSLKDSIEYALASNEKKLANAEKWDSFVPANIQDVEEAEKSGYFFYSEIRDMKYRVQSAPQSQNIEVQSFDTSSAWSALGGLKLS